ncbi:hypothetical protein [Methanomethylovorans hollandica]|uniref:hypothetical protein n=1 Tax=Methanomethylovorans hollandica TaxID=101192 RepID=UPI0012EABD7F|nr:hypothetical protein [Methanomethylovorans hollandica]
MTGTKVCIRIDIDTVRDTQVLPVVLEILDQFNAMPHSLSQQGRTLPLRTTGII